MAEPDSLGAAGGDRFEARAAADHTTTREAVREAIRRFLEVA